jgi:hypothetical protein
MKSENFGVIKQFDYLRIIIDVKVYYCLIDKLNVYLIRESSLR